MKFYSHLSVLLGSLVFLMSVYAGEGTDQDKTADCGALSVADG